MQGGWCDRPGVGNERDDIDEALDTAVDRVREAQEHFLDAPAQTEERFDAAIDVEQRAEDVEELASEAVEHSDDPPA
jgi:hypothetical protein